MSAKKNHLKMFLIVIVLSAFTTSGIAQSSGKSIKKFTKSFSKAYNAKDHVALTAMFTSDAVRIDTEGKTTNGAAQIGAEYARVFSATDQKVVINHAGVKDNPDGSAVSNGTYTVTGTVKSSGDKIALAGTYENTLVKQNGVWKISQMKLSAAK
jgi:ketosteroid isomerase-like protein